ncbi:MAG: 30S ribosomal protein S7, partial [Calothrix sp. SM1_5_4]|nr:30S ribosomal protein S7 [Calothrix sp. SM1_5_4]
MSRRKSAEKREVLPDPVYNDVVVAKFVNKMMIQGRKSMAYKTLYTALDDLRAKVS